eukprot:7205438-Pyramimonas_sp.AAC.1
MHDPGAGSCAAGPMAHRYHYPCPSPCSLHPAWGGLLTIFIVVPIVFISRSTSKMGREILIPVPGYDSMMAMA